MVIKGINFSRGLIRRLDELVICPSNCLDKVFGNWKTNCPKCNSALVGYDLQDGDIIEGNFSQSNPHTDISAYFHGKNVTVRRFNFMNCDVPPSVTLDKSFPGKLHIQKDFCSHLHPNRLEQGEITQYPDNCSQVVDTDTVTIDGQLIKTIYHYEDKIV